MEASALDVLYLGDAKRVQDVCSAERPVESEDTHRHTEAAVMVDKIAIGEVKKELLSTDQSR